MRVVVADPYVERELIEAEGHDYVADLRAALADADIVSLHMPAHADGHAEFGIEEFAAMKPASCSSTLPAARWSTRRCSPGR